MAMKLTGHKTEAVYRRYAIVSEADLTEGLKKLARLQPDLATVQPHFRTRIFIFPRKLWRRGRDLNSRIGYPISGFQGPVQADRPDTDPHDKAHE